MASITRPTVNRAVHLRITPRPSNLGESREIMRLISQFGEVEYFKSLKYDALSAPNAALVIYKEEGAARECVKRSPIRFRMGKVRPRKSQQEADETVEEGREKQAVRDTSMTRPIGTNASRGPVGTPFGLAGSRSRSLSTSSLPTPPSNPIRMPFDPPPPADPEPTADTDESRLFQTLASTCRRHFRDQIDAGHYHGSFAIDSKMPGQEDLAKKVPFPGLSCVDWKAVDRPWKTFTAEKRRTRSKGRLGLLAGQDEARLDTIQKPFGDIQVGVGTDEREVVKTPEAEHSNDALNNIAKGWEQFFPSISSESEPVERYSRRPK